MMNSGSHEFIEGGGVDKESKEIRGPLGFQGFYSLHIAYHKFGKVYESIW